MSRDRPLHGAEAPGRQPGGPASPSSGAAAHPVPRLHEGAPLALGVFLLVAYEAEVTPEEVR